MSKHYDPEAEAHARGFFVSTRELPHGILGITDCVEGIWVDERLLQRERRSTLAHELAHADLYAERPGRMGSGAYGRCGSVEDECNERAALKLIAVDDLIDACKWSDSLEEAAEELIVNSQMVRARLRTLTKDEAKRFDREVGRGYSARLRGKPMKRTPLKRR